MGTSAADPVFSTTYPHCPPRHQFQPRHSGTVAQVPLDALCSGAMAKKVRVGVLFGGRSGEHEVSLLSAASVLQNIDKKKYEVVPIGITKDGRWVTSGHAEQLLRGEHKDSERNLRAGDPDYTESAAVLAKGESVLVPPVPSSDSGSLIPFESERNRQLDHAGDHLISVDIVFPVL